MTAAIQRLRAEVAHDFAQWDELLRSIAGIDLSLGPEQRARSALAALTLHHAYSAVEAALARITRHLEGSEPTGREWHQELLAAAALDVSGVRPRLLGEGSYDKLRELLGFRHFLRHAYAAWLDVAKLERLIRVAQDASPLVARDARSIDDFLAKLGA